VAERFRRQPAELLYVGSIPIPSFGNSSLYKNDLTPFLWDLKKRGYKETTIVQNYAKILKHLMKNCDVNNPDSVLAFLATKDISEGRKELMADCYANYCRWKRIPFVKPRYRRIDRLPMIPLEKDIEALIAALPKKVGIFTRTIYETGARCGEIWALKWVDVDFQNTALMINKPEKNSRARRIKVSAQLIGLLSTLPRNCEYVFRKYPQAKSVTMQSYFIREKKKISNALCNPKIVQITWKSLRHYKATMEYARTKDILYVKELLGHVNIMNTLVYTHLINFDSEEFVSARAVRLARLLKNALS
jgi:integrase